MLSTDVKSTEFDFGAFTTSSSSLSATGQPHDSNGGCYVPDTGFPLNTRF